MMMMMMVMISTIVSTEKNTGQKKTKKASASSLRSTSTRPWTFGGSFAVHPTPACLACSLVASEVEAADVEKQFGGQLRFKANLQSH